MSLVMIKCPGTGRAVSTAIETEPSVFRQLPRINARMFCPACGQEHVWAMSSAWLSDEPHTTEAARPIGSAAA